MNVLDLSDATASRANLKSIDAKWDVERSMV